MRAPEGKGGREQGTEKLFEEIMIENVPNLLKERVAQAQEAQRVQNKVNPKRPAPRRVIMKTPKVKDEKGILNAARKQQLVTHRELS